MDYIQVNHKNFDEVFNRVLTGAIDFYVHTYSRVTKISSKTIKSWEAKGLKVISKDSDGRGFRMGAGRGTVYLFHNQLIAY